jgi:hypothetical protein
MLDRNPAGDANAALHKRKALSLGTIRVVLAFPGVKALLTGM